MVFVLIKTLADKKIRTEASIRKVLDWNVIGVISSMYDSDKNPSSSAKEWKFSTAINNK